MVRRKKEKWAEGRTAFAPCPLGVLGLDPLDKPEDDSAR